MQREVAGEGGQERGEGLGCRDSPLGTLWTVAAKEEGDPPRWEEVVGQQLDCRHLLRWRLAGRSGVGGRSVLNAAEEQGSSRRDEKERSR